MFLSVTEEIGARYSYSTTSQSHLKGSGLAYPRPGSCRPLSQRPGLAPASCAEWKGQAIRSQHLASESSASPTANPNQKVTGNNVAPHTVRAQQTYKREATAWQKAAEDPSLMAQKQGTTLPEGGWVSTESGRGLV